MSSFKRMNRISKEVTSRLNRISRESMFKGPQRSKSSKLQRRGSKVFDSTQNKDSFEDAAVLVSDMTGFTSGTRKHGIVHVASVIVRMRQICLPILHKHGAMWIGTEGDNLIVLLPNAAAAIGSALGMRDAISRHNASLPESRSHHQIQLGGIGIHCGGPVVLDRKSDALRGAVSSLAYFIGEELCSDGTVLASQTIVERLGDGSSHLGCTFREVPQEEGDESAPLPVYEVVPSASSSVLGLFSSDAEPLPAADDDRYLHKSLLPLAKRFACSDDASLAALDAELASLLRPAAVLMFRVFADAAEASSGYSTADAESAKKSEEACLRALRPIFKRYRGNELEPMLWVFESPLDAVKAALAAARASRSAADAPLPSERFRVSGFGVHHGSLLLIEGTDVHWGDPVNTSSKLGQDLAKDGEVLVSSAARDALHQAAPSWVRRALEMRPREITISKVEMVAYSTIERSWTAQMAALFCGGGGGASSKPATQEPPPTQLTSPGEVRA